MGVPSFYRWLSEKYPKTVIYVKEDVARKIDGIKIPVDASKPNPNGIEFDNLYLDMNGIIHPASHPEDGPTPETEDDMYLAIFEYIERVFNIVRPRNVLFMAVDGVAPRAKMNQQRSRRFRSAQEMAESVEAARKLREELIAAGSQIPDEPEAEPFDSNTITPGTPFMARLAMYLRWFVRFKLETDEGWRNLKVIISDAAVPGEGEHKAVDFIRRQRAAPGYNPNTRHVIHGLDADLIMLALATHEPNFFILREEVTFTKVGQSTQQKLEGASAAGPASAGEDLIQHSKPFQMIKVAVLREYLEKELGDSDYSAAGGFSLERVIDDFVLMVAFVGNDFLPHLPSLEIREGAIDTILDIYKTCFPELGGYITNCGEIRIEALQLMMRKLGEMEDEVLRKRRQDEERFKSRKEQKKRNAKERKASQEHLQMIRRLTAGSAASHAVALGEGAPAAPPMLGAAADANSERPSKRARYYGDAGPTATVDDPESFRIRHRSPGGVRVLAPGASEADSKRLVLMDKIREFADFGKQGASLKLSGLDNRERAAAHEYCEELELIHDTKGQDPHKYIVVRHTPSDGEDVYAGLSPEELIERFGDNVKASVREANDKIAEGMKDEVDLGRPGWKKRYYDMKLPDQDPQDMAYAYLEGLVWVMKYYYHGCASWDWFYPYHYAPFASDLPSIDPAKFRVRFQQGAPFRPFEQLMGVLPPASKAALPRPMQELMDESSVIGEFYPSEFELDLNGKSRLWQAVILLPFIDEKKLLEHVKPLEDALEGEERDRNEFGVNHVFVHQHAHPEIGKLVLSLPERRGSKLPPKPPLAELNELAAMVLKAEMEDDNETASKLRLKLEESRAAVAAYVTAAEDSKGIPLDPAISPSFAGTVLCDPRFPRTLDPCPGLICESRREDHPYFPRTFKNSVLVAEYRFPEFSNGPHRSVLLPGLEGPARELDSMDTPNFGRFRRARGSAPTHPHGGRRDRSTGAPPVSHMPRGPMPNHGGGRPMMRPPPMQYHGGYAQAAPMHGGGHGRFPAADPRAFGGYANGGHAHGGHGQPDPTYGQPPPRGSSHYDQSQWGGGGGAGWPPFQPPQQQHHAPPQHQQYRPRGPDQWRPPPGPARYY